MKPTGRLADLARIQQQGGDKVVLPLVEEYLLGQWGDKGDRKSEVLHVSEIAKKDWCERGSYLRITGGTWPAEKFSFTLQSIFDEGHQIHDKWQSWLAATGQLWGDWRCDACNVWVRCAVRAEVDQHAVPCLRGEHLWRYKEVSLAHGLIQGREDGAIGDRLVEFKSVGLGALRHESKALLAKCYKELADGGMVYDLDAVWKGLRQPLASHVRQANMYLWLAQQMGQSGDPNYAYYRRFEKASIVYEFKPNQQSREFVIPLSMDIVQPLLDRVNVVQWALKAGAPPPCRYGGCPQCQPASVEGRGKTQREAEAVPVRRLVHRLGGSSESEAELGPKTRPRRNDVRHVRFRCPAGIRFRDGARHRDR
jgi:hypothetical protein